MKILDELECILPTIEVRVKEHTQAHFVLDSYESLQLAERNFTNTTLSVVPALPALIRVARAANELEHALIQAGKLIIAGKPVEEAIENIAACESSVSDALQQLRDLSTGSLEAKS